MGQDWLKPPASNGFRPSILAADAQSRSRRAASPGPGSVAAKQRGVDALTDDILVAILGHLGAVDLARVAKGASVHVRKFSCIPVSRRLRLLASNHRRWKQLHCIHFSYHKHVFTAAQEDYYTYFRDCSIQEIGAIKRETMMSRLATSFLKQPVPGAFKCDYDPTTRSRDFRLLVVGPPASDRTGKTSLLMRFLGGEFSPVHTETMGASFASKKVMIDGLLIRMSYVDAPGAERYMQVLETFYKDMHAVVFVYSTASKDSVPRMKSWVKVIKDNPSTPKDLSMVVVGTKIDGKRIVDSESLSAWCKELDMPLFETSAKTGEGVQEVFCTLVRSFREKHTL